MAHCYHPSQPGHHPHPSQAECSSGLIRASKYLQSICVDAGMYLGARAYLEIGADAHFRIYQKYFGLPSENTFNTYQVKDFTDLVCNNV